MADITITIPHGMTTHTIAEVIALRDAVITYLREIAPDMSFAPGTMGEVDDGKDDVILTVTFSKAAPAE